MPLQQLAIFGPGLIGGSVALAARRRELCERIVLWSRDETERGAARRLGVADVVTDDPAEAVRGADLVLLCAPPAALPNLAHRIAPHLEPGATVSDVASVKAGLVEELTAILQRPGETGSRFVGAHPMAGAERHGLQSARADLFERCVCLLTPIDGRTLASAVETVSLFWQGIGARVQWMTPPEHDAAVATVSHLPHLVAAALAGLPDDPATKCAGPGWRDMTRLAAGSPELWTEILSHNRRPVTDALRGMISRLGEALEFLEAGRESELAEFLTSAKRRRDELQAEP